MPIDPGVLPAWQRLAEPDAIRREFRFPTFGAAWAFMSQVALLAEKMDHHPDWSNSYDRVTITLTTHDSGGTTARDRAMAEAIDRLVPPPGP